MPDPIIPPTPPVDTPPTPPASMLPALPQDWYSHLPDDLKSEESLKLFHDIPSLAKSLVHAQKQFGTDKIPIPSKFATEDDWTNVYRKLGLPQDVKEYAIEAPKELGFEEARLNEYKVAAHKAGILPKQLQKLMSWHVDDTKKVLHEAEQKMQMEMQNAQNELKAEWGNAYDKKVSQAQMVVKMLNEPKLAEFLDKTKLGDHPQMVKVFAKLGEIMGEKKVEGLGSESGKFGNVVTPEVAKREIATIQGNQEHPYNNARHPGHHLAVAEMESLFQQAFPHEDGA